MRSLGKQSARLIPRRILLLTFVPLLPSPANLLAAGGVVILVPAESATSATAHEKTTPDASKRTARTFTCLYSNLALLHSLESISLCASGLIAARNKAPRKSQFRSAIFLLSNI
jgi:hypothetical protein